MPASPAASEGPIETLRLRDLFGRERPVVGMVHLPALPGAPEAELGMEALRERAVADARALAEGGVDGVLVENYGDAPFVPDDVDDSTVAAMAVLTAAVRRAVEVPVGVNVLRNDARAALSVAEAAGASFVRVNVWTGARLGDQGLLEGRAHEVLRLRRRLDSRVRVFADAAVKHSVPLAPRELADEVADVLARADGVVVGSALERDGVAGRPVDPERVRRFVDAAEGART